jgi:hypothetical protein
MLSLSYTPSTPKAEAERLWIWGQPELHKETLAKKTNSISGQAQAFKWH